MRCPQLIVVAVPPEDHPGPAIPFRFEAKEGAPPSVLVGREAPCAVRLEGARLSRAHLRLEVRLGASESECTLIVEDQQSATGTWLDGVRLAAFTPTPILPGQRIEAGGWTLRARLDAAHGLTSDSRDGDALRAAWALPAPPAPPTPPTPAPAVPHHGRAPRGVETLLDLLPWVGIISALGALSTLW
jgi:hypothetical protein